MPGAMRSADAVLGVPGDFVLGCRTTLHVDNGMAALLSVAPAAAPPPGELLTLWGASRLGKTLTPHSRGCWRPVACTCRTSRLPCSSGQLSTRPLPGHCHHQAVVVVDLALEPVTALWKSFGYFSCLLQTLAMGAAGCTSSGRRWCSGTTRPAGWSTGAPGSSWMPRLRCAHTLPEARSRSPVTHWVCPFCRQSCWCVRRIIGGQLVHLPSPSVKRAFQQRPLLRMWLCWHVAESFRAPGHWPGFYSDQVVGGARAHIAWQGCERC